MNEVNLHYTESALRLIARKAITKNTGARSLRALLENILMDAITGKDIINAVVVDEEAVGSGAKILHGQGALDRYLSQHLQVLTTNPYQDPHNTRMMTYGVHANPNLHGIYQTTMPLPLQMEEEPVYVNAKQYHRILRRRESRAKAELEKKVIKSKKEPKSGVAMSTLSFNSSDHVSTDYTVNHSSFEDMFKRNASLNGNDGLSSTYNFDFIDWEEVVHCFKRDKGNMPDQNEKIISKYYPKEYGPVTNVDPIGNSPVIIRKDLLEKIDPTLMNVSLRMKDDPVTDRTFGWVLEMYAYAMASALHGVQHILWKDFMIQVFQFTFS
ncbi:hypothetical protein L2E82_49852 [Cichorium intybus]|uniref:Uncharacterized protein n=1 Tax=Cichorium intybus TaxID=13427 RepID=A0ACB8Z1C0_CICIN|nr:hypothetical protein L2E82_49852 [Cichorium intybus]